jgi:hypothetical protein
LVAPVSALIAPVLLSFPPVAADYKEHHTDVSVKFIIKLTPEKMQEALATGLHTKFKMSTKMSTGEHASI